MTWVAGISIGAINAAIIAGNEPHRRISRLKKFWYTVSGGMPNIILPEIDKIREAMHLLAAGTVASFGVPGMFRPRLWPATLMPEGTAGAISFYDSAPLKETLDACVNWELLNDGPVRLAVGAGGFIEIIKPDDIALKDLLERPLHRNAAKMDDAVTIGHHRIDGAGVGQIALQALFVRSGRIERRKIGKTQYLGHRCEALAHDTAELACRTGNKKPFHYNSPKRMDCGSTKLRKTRIQPLRRGRDISAPLDLIIQIVQKADNIYYVIYATIMKDEFDADRRNKAGRQPGIC